MKHCLRTAKGWLKVLTLTLTASLLLFSLLGCGEEKKTTTTDGATSAAPVGKAKGTIYVAVTGQGELTAGAGNMGFAIIDLATKKVEMVNIAESKAPHGIFFAGSPKVADNTRGRVALEQPTSVYLGNAQDGSVLMVDLATKKVTKTIPAPSETLKICGMQMGPDGKIYMSSMGDGKVYALDPKTDTTSATSIGGGDASESICGIAWNSGDTAAYLSNMFNPKDPNQAGYLAKVEFPSGKLIKKIENITKPSPSGAPMAHQTEATPDGKFLYVTAGSDGAIVKVDLATEQIVKSIPIGKEPHAIVFSSDGKTAYITVRHEPVENESSIFVYDVEKDQVIDRIPGVPAPLACGLILVEV